MIVNGLNSSEYNGYIKSNEIPRADSKDASIFNFENSNVNGEIDVDFSQGNIGDCALLSSVYSLSLSEEGSKAIKDAISVNVNSSGEVESYNIHFQGIDETYTVTQKELEKAKEYHGNYETERVYSRGDDDMTIIELAIEKCFEKSKDKELRDLVDNYTKLNKEDKLNGVNPAAVTYLFTGEKSETVVKNDSDLRKKFIPCATYTIKDLKGNDVTFEEGNEYTAKGITEDKSYIYIKNSDDANKDIVLPTEEFLSEIYIPNINEANKKSFELLNSFENDNDNSMLVFATVGMENVIDENGDTVELVGPHAYCVSAVKDGVVTLKNPHDTSKDINIPINNLLSLEMFNLYNLDFDTEEVNQ